MRILLLGNTGQLGWELERALSTLGALNALDYPLLDMTKDELVRETVRKYKPNVIVNATAYTAVDQAENQPQLPKQINELGPGILAEEANKLDAALIHYSTDYVFDGTKGQPYIEEDQPNPLNIYGKSKLGGDLLVQQICKSYLIFRPSWIYSLRRDSFVTKTLQWGRSQRILRLVEDQVSNPTWARLLAEITALILAKGGEQVVPWLTERRGLYHLAGDGYASRLEWGREILRLDPQKEQQIVEAVIPAYTEDFPTPAKRPLFSALNCDKFKTTFSLQLPPWQTALKLAMQNIAKDAPGIIQPGA